MSGSKDPTDAVSPGSLAFEYVTGTLRADERRQFEQSLASDESAQQEVAFWEEHLMSLHPSQERQPSSDTWEAIASRLVPPRAGAEPAKTNTLTWANFLQWIAPTAAAMMLMLVLFGYYPNAGKHNSSNTPNTDYVAILTNDDGNAIVTALTASGDKSMWLKWEISQFSESTSAQLWAISKRDNEIRPIAVLDSTGTLKIELDEALWRLVTDSSHLILTEEELGGSALDEPSEKILAKGICVRFSPDTKAT